MEDIVTRLRRAVDNEPFMLGGEHDLLKDALMEITTLLGCCDGAAAQDAHVRREREEHRAEVDRQRAEIERLQKEADLTREALGGWALVPPDGGADPTHERVAAVVAEVEKQRADNERLTGKLKLVANALNETISKYHEVGDQNDRLDAENERLRAALEGKP